MKDVRPRHIIDMIVGGETQNKEVMHLKISPPTFRWKNSVITFTDEDYPKGVQCRYGHLTVQLDIVNQDVRKVLIDNGSSADIIFLHALIRMILEDWRE